MADATYPPRADRNIVPPTAISRLDPKDVATVGVELLGLIAASAITGALVWLALSALLSLPYLKTLSPDIAPCAAGFASASVLMALAKITGLWK